MRLVRAACVLPLLLAGCAVIPGNYEAKSGERTVRVALKPDGFAALSTMFSSRPTRWLSEGTWRDERGAITLELRGDQPGRLVFRRAGDQLVAREWDRAVWGEQGPGALQQVW